MNTTQGLVGPSDIADMAGVSRGAVSNWRKRAEDFPSQVAGTAAKPLFSRQDVARWLETRGHEVKKDSGEADVWAAMNMLRGSLPADEAAELVLSLAVARKTGVSRENTPRGVEPATIEQVKGALSRVSDDKLGDAADFALERFSRAQGKSGANFGFVGSRPTALLANVASSMRGGVLYDPACGIAAALIESISRGASPDRIVGHDISQHALRMAAERAELHGVEIELSSTNVLAADLDPHLKADLILAEPPFGMRWEGPERLTDQRFEFGVPPRNSADTAWLQHVVAHLNETGRGYVLTPMGALFRTGEEGKIRTELVRRGCIEAIVALPGKLLPQTSIPLALWVLRRPTREAADVQILLLDASKTVDPENHVARWLKDPKSRSEIPHTEVSVGDVLAAGGGLAPQRWIDQIEPEPGQVAAAYIGGWGAIHHAAEELRESLTRLDYRAEFPKARVMTVGQLVEQGVLEVRRGHPKQRYEDAPPTFRSRVATPADVRDGTLRTTGVGSDLYEDADVTAAGDVLVTVMNRIKTRVDVVGGHLPSNGVYRLRVLDPEVLLPDYLASALTGGWNERFQGGTTIQQAPVRELEIPLIPLANQQRVQQVCDALTLIHDSAARVATETLGVRSALLDAVRYDASLVDKQSRNVSPAGQNRDDDSEVNR